MTNEALIESLAGLIAVCLLYAALCDVSVRIIPNYLSVAVAALALPFRVIDHDLVGALSVASITFAVLTGAWALRVLGGGDVKLWTACSMLLPPVWPTQGLFSVRVVLFGGVVALAYLALRFLVRQPPRAESPKAPADKPWRDQALMRRVWRAEKWRARRGGSIPYGVAIALSALCTFWPPVHG